MNSNLKDLLHVIVSKLVHNPEEVKIELREEEDRTVLELRVAPEDIGRVIGRQGRIIKAIRILVKAASSDPQHKVMVDVIDENAKEAE